MGEKSARWKTLALKRALILVEGQTEERFVKEVLNPDLWQLGLHLEPTILVTKQVKRGPNFKGGIGSFGQVQRDVPRLLGDTAAALVTTMFDLYGLPTDFPGMTDVGERQGREKAEYIEEALRHHFNNARFFAFLMVHEFEAVVYADPGAAARTLQAPAQQAALQAEKNGFPTAEDINAGIDTHPSRRLRLRFPYYQKALFGPAIASAIGLPRIRQECPHFNQWLQRLEALAQAP